MTLTDASEELVKECANLWARWTGAPGTEVLRARLAAIEEAARAAAQAEVARLREALFASDTWLAVYHDAAGNATEGCDCPVSQQMERNHALLAPEARP